MMLAPVSSQELNTKSDDVVSGAGIAGADARLDVQVLQAHMCGVAANLSKRRACQCPVCMDVMTAPARLKCRHVFCQACIDTVIELAQPIYPRCPECNVEFRRREVSAEEMMDNYVQAYRLLQSVARRNGAAVSDSQMPLDEVQPQLDTVPHQLGEAPPSARAVRRTPAKRPSRGSQSRKTTGWRRGRASRPKTTATRAKPKQATAASTGNTDLAAVATAAAPTAAAPTAAAPAALAAKSSGSRTRARRSRPARQQQEMSEEEQLALALKLSAQDERIQRQKRRHEGDLAAAAAAAAGSSHRELKNLSFAAPGSRQAVALGPSAAAAAKAADETAREA
jgi:hypothetical protein